MRVKFQSLILVLTLMVCRNEIHCYEKKRVAGSGNRKINQWWCVVEVQEDVKEKGKYMV